MSSSVLICSASILTADGRIANVGDEALTECLATALRRRVPGLDVTATLNLAGHPRSVLPPGRVSPRPIRELWRAIGVADVVVVGGGTLLQEDVRPRPYEPVAGLLRYVLAVVVLARVRRRPVVIVGVGAENLGSRRARLAARVICRSAASVSARDEESAQLLASLSGAPASTAADPLFLDDAPAARGACGPGAILVNVRADAPSGLLERLAELLARELDQGRRVVLVPMDRRSGHDDRALARLVALVGRPERFTTIGAESSWREVLAAFTDAELCVGMRLHFLIFGVLAGARVVALTSSEKTVSFAHELGLSACAIDEPDALPAAVEAARRPDFSAVDSLSRRAEAALDPVVALCA